MRRLFKSLRGQLLLGLLVPLVAVALINVWFSYQNARRAAYIVLDRTLVASADSIAEQIRSQRGQLDVEIPPAALGMFGSKYADVVYYRVVDTRGPLVSGYQDLPPPPDAPSITPEFYDASFRGAKLRLVTLLQPAPAASATLLAQVTVGVTLQATNAMIDDLWMSSGLQQGALVVVAFALAWIWVLRGFQPLLRMGREVASRRPNEFKPLDEDAVQRELLPFVRALNLYMQRLSGQLAAQRRFIANAAHQMRTPLTLLRTQAQVALREDSPSLKDEAARGVIDTTKHMTRLTNQLLVLSKMEADMHPVTTAPVDIVALTRSVLEEYADLFVAGDIDLAFEPGVPSALVLGDPTMLREVVANLADNALHYADGSAVEVTIDAHEGHVAISVLDSGPGIAPEDRELVFERFYRIKERAGRSSGSGLGLAIVREIVTASGGTIELANNPRGRGLLVIVSLPRVAERGRTPLEEHLL